jgi:hypothetical protein
MQLGALARFEQAKPSMDHQGANFQTNVDSPMSPHLDSSFLANQPIEHDDR